MPIRLQAANNCGGTLASAVSAGATSLSVNLATGSTAWPSTPFHVALWGASDTGVVKSKYEVDEVSSVTGTANPYTLTLTAGTANAWSSGDWCVLTFDTEAYRELQSSALLASVFYNPSTGTSYTSGSGMTALQAVDSTNLTIRFVAPPSGSVTLVATISTLYMNAAGAGGWLGWLVHGGTTQIADAKYIIGQEGMGGNGYHCGCSQTWVVTGLTPGTTYQYDLAYGSSNTGYPLVIYVGGTGNLGSANGGIVLEVWAS
jgi:hypothetical protein